jgi:serine/threonine protein kinase
MVERNWSGRGQHAQFQQSEKKTLDDILNVQDVLGSTSTAIVQSVMCKRILLARKTIRCNRYFTKAKAIEEVAHLSRLDHSHVVQVIGTYTMGNELSILMYPVAEYSLDSFINDLDPRMHSEEHWEDMISSLEGFIGCLAGTVAYIHSSMTKHMDIKPKNILVRNMTRSNLVCKDVFKIYIADFGISRSYDTLDATETEGPTMFTKKYAAPEVVDRQKRGLAADIFSLGCVFVEIGATLDHYTSSSFVDAFDNTDAKLRGKRFDHQHAVDMMQGDQDPLHEIDDILNANEFGDTSYQANIGRMRKFASELQNRDNGTSLAKVNISKMLSEDPSDRPSAYMLAHPYDNRWPCCQDRADYLEANPWDRRT